TRLAAEGLGELVVVVGHPAARPGPGSGRNARGAIAQNCASVLHRGHVTQRAAKHHLPNYGVFDEYRVFAPGDGLTVLEVDLGASGSARVPLLICEDLWLDDGPVTEAAEAEADVVLVINASPFERDKDEARLPLAA